MSSNNNDNSNVAPTADSQKEHWCNFCGYTTDNLPDYLAHSCVDVLKANGHTVVPTGQMECR